MASNKCRGKISQEEIYEVNIQKNKETLRAATIRGRMMMLLFHAFDFKMQLQSKRCQALPVSFISATNCIQTNGR